MKQHSPAAAWINGPIPSQAAACDLAAAGPKHVEGGFGTEYRLRLNGEVYTIVARWQSTSGVVNISFRGRLILRFEAAHFQIFAGPRHTALTRAVIAALTPGHLQFRRRDDDWELRLNASMATVAFTDGIKLTYAGAVIPKTVAQPSPAGA